MSQNLGETSSPPQFFLGGMPTGCENIAKILKGCGTSENIAKILKGCGTSERLRTTE